MPKRAKRVRRCNKPLENERIAHYITSRALSDACRRLEAAWRELGAAPQPNYLMSMFK